MATSLSSLEHEKSSYARVAAPCPYFGTCGGCSVQDLAYVDQLALKQRRLQQAFTSIGCSLVVEVIGLEEPWRYRNKAEFTFSEVDGRLALGYHAARSFWRVVDLDDCLLLPEPAMRAVRDLRALAAETGLPAYHPRTHQGFFRYVLVRSSQATGAVLICLITAPGHAAEVAGLAREIMQRHPALSSVYWGVTARLADVSIPEQLIHLGGATHLEEQIGPFRLQLHPFSFLQPAGAQAHRMYSHLCHALGRQPQAVAWDLYCGLGLVGLYLASHVQRVYGIDVEPQHLELARLNAAANEVHNVEFHAGRVEALLKDRRFWLQQAKPDLVVVDPPRAGLHPSVCASLLAARPRTMAYLSCNAQSLIRDLQLLCSGFPRYHLTHAQAFDMFPQTNHVEILTWLERA